MTDPAPPALPGPPRPRVVATIGKFDGVHVGHRQLVARLVAESAWRQLPAAVIVLHPDPAAVLAGRRVPLLTTVAERARRLRALGVELVWPLEFTTALAALTPAGFLDLVASRLDVAAFVVGPDFAFGHGRAGTIDTLRSAGALRGFEVVVVAPVPGATGKVGSRAVRAAIEAGDIADATELLGVAPRLVGRVVHGAARGRTLGFPTANLALAEDFAVPANGIYTVHASWHWPDGEGEPGQAEGLASVGVRPTFDKGPRVVEIYLLDFSGDLYGAELTVDFLARQRGEERFDSVDALVAQMHADVAVARATLASLSPAAADQP